MRFHANLLLLFWGAVLSPLSGARLSLPTANDFLFKGKPEKFYMFCHRNFEGKASRPWTAGQYGYVRNMKRTPDGLIGTRLHEGIDIAALKRDRNQEPLDPVYPIAPGTVVHVNQSSGRSNYGKYLIVEHDFEGGQFHSLYAHFKSINCQTGQSVTRDSQLGTLGYTGRGTTRERAHLHLEFGLICSNNYDGYLKSVLPSLNYFGNYNGLNFIGCDVSRLLEASRGTKEIDLAEEIRKEAPYFKVTIPNHGPLELVQRNPFLLRARSSSSSPSWEISFTAAGFPLSVYPSNRKVSGPRVSWVQPYDGQHADRTLSRITGRGRSATLTPRGMRHIRLLTENFTEF